MAVNRHDLEEAPSGAISARQRRQFALEYGNLALQAPPSPPPSAGGAGAGMLILGKFRTKSRRKRRH